MEFGSKTAEFGPQLADIGDTSAGLGQACQPNLANLARSQTKSTGSAQFRTKTGGNRPCVARTEQSSARTRPDATKMIPGSAKISPNSGNCGPNSAEFRPSLESARPYSGPRVEQRRVDVWGGCRIERRGRRTGCDAERWLDLGVFAPSWQDCFAKRHDIAMTRLGGLVGADDGRLRHRI